MKGHQPAAGVYVALTTAGPDESASARNLLRRLLADVAGVVAAAEPVAARTGGQPFLPRRPGIAVSLSHSGGWVAAAVSEIGAVGIDVQAPEPASPALLRRCCRAETRRRLSLLPGPERDLEFAWLWTAQEACVKATGEGLAGRPWTVPVTPGQREGVWRDVRWRTLRDRCTVPLSCAYLGQRPR